MAKEKITTSKVATETLKKNADRLGEVSERLMEAYNILSGANVPEATMPWLPAHTKVVNRFFLLCGLFKNSAELAVDAHEEGRLTDVEERKARNKTDYQNRVAKKRAAGVEPKPRGRPKKKDAS